MLQPNDDQGYKEFQAKINTLVKLIEQQIKIAQLLNKHQQVDNLRNLQNIVQSTTFKVMILGEFKRGKSTFINSLLGEEILPAFATPCTAIINEVKWGETQRAVLYFNQVDGAAKKEPMEIPVDEIEEYVVIKDDADQSQAINESPYEKLELFWPLELCKNGVEIIDSPGLNEHKTRQQVTESYLITVDAIILVLSCEQLFSKSEQEVVVNKLKPMGHEDIFFVCNRINMIRKKDEIDKVKQFAIAKLSPHTRLGAERIFFINALGALDGKLDNDHEALQKSGVTQLEAVLQKFLTNERGRVKILRPAQELKNAINEIRKTIPEQIGMLQTDVVELEERYAAAQEPLNILEGKRRSIIQKLALSIEDSKEQVSYKTKDFCRELVPKIKTIAQEYELQTEIKLLFQDPRPSIEAAVKEITSHLESQLEAEFLNWQNTELEPLLSRRMENIKNALEHEATEFINKVDNLRLELSGVSISKVEVSKGDVGVRDVSAVERIFSAAGGFLIGGLGAAAIGATFGYQEMLKSLIPQLVIGIIGYIFLGLNPITLVPMLVAAFVQGKLMEGGLGNRIKQEVGKKFSEQINSTTVDIVDRVGKGVSEELNKVKNLVDQGLEAEIRNIRQQVDNVLAEKQKGQAEVDKKLKQLDILAKEVNRIDQELYDLISQV
ncbi:dynamin family protein [Anabaena sp. UHCC 0451]|uniref:dynamin family protein n=1 Tax=Anabaena sp. UHCC 0451 TaxID=2055235 RepID=UPI002B1FF186|nr:dynamin family protein [Anabaena sp. UHCC 0451]MEA5577831.1 dynamin family protein [Anabaena sp. UHCC 0451]